METKELRKALSKLCVVGFDVTQEPYSNMNLAEMNGKELYEMAQEDYENAIILDYVEEFFSQLNSDMLNTEDYKYYIVALN